MSEELKGQMERRTAQQGVVPASPSTRSTSVSGKETVRSKQWRGPRRGQMGGQYPDQGNRWYPKPRSSNERRNPQQQYRRATQDKRPNPRAGYQNVDNRNNNIGDIDLAVDLQSAQESSSSKKNSNSLNYLLNFKYAPRERMIEQRARSNSKRHNSFNKERFLQANCQFVVSDSADYTVYAVEPDILVDWSLIEQVRIFSHEVSSCPICLYPPTAAKITRCGHVYCWSCILHYLSLSEKSWHKCPICFESINKKDLKSVIAMESHCFAVGQTITMRLMKKMKNATLVLPKSQWKERELIPFNINDSVDTCYSKLLLASPEDVLQQVIEKEESALSVQYMEAKMEQSSELCFIESANLELKARKDELTKSMKSVEEVVESLEKVSLHSSDEDSSGSKEEENLGWNVYLPASNCIQDVGEYEAAFSDDEDVKSSEVHDADQKTDNLVAKDTVECNSDIIEQASNEAAQEASTLTAVKEGCESTNETVHVALNGNKKPWQENQYYYFYQAEDGQNIFLHPINARCLIKEYGSLENCPEYISAKILEMEAITQTEESRKRYRYLKHLPLTCEFVICELEIKPPLISSNTLECFKGEIQKRKQRRQRKMKVENRRESKVDAKMASIEGRPSQRSTESLNLSSEVDFPTQSSPTLTMVMSPLAHRPGPFTQLAASESYHDDESLVDEAEGIASLESNGFSPPSFAQALRTGKIVESSKPVRRQVQDAAPAKPKGEGLADNDSDEDYLPPPTYQSTFSDALSIAISRGLEQHQAQEARQAGASVGTGKRQKKSKKKLLFTTGHMKFN
ncbi:RING finger protein 10-like [Actinia tenebrosa]|uniref:E3 ubiquitin-protein ligase RNF10 n=1 Tax=Actinia tenebrosa TaxID=6105 RepID=A0A6P8H8B9_ACTTE|nr:RING finger protein 10-like [Actinia tenebrosa]